MGRPIPAAPAGAPDGDLRSPSGPSLPPGEVTPQGAEVRDGPPPGRRAWRTTGEQHASPEVGAPLRPSAAPEVVLGTITEVDPPRLLAFTTGPGEPGDHVRLELGEGTGHGARLRLTVSGPTDRPDERDAAVDQWGGGAVEVVAAAGADWAREHA